ncbi:hypothetical protein L1887_43916 [Cichorium endivia]|nr:hypothetical protein L1887_43916 [Cichorium endivia]
MKKTTAILLGTALLFTTNAFAAQLLTKNEFKKVASQYQKIGTVSTSNEVSVDDAKKELIEKADKKGADVLPPPKRGGCSPSFLAKSPHERGYACQCMDNAYSSHLHCVQHILRPDNGSFLRAL